MCGVFGFVAKKGHEVDLDQLKRIAKTTMRRGEHAFGFSWIDSAGRLRMYKEQGRMVDRVGMLNLAADARMLIGHCRMATHGRPDENQNNHPHPVDGGWLVHNGVLFDYRELMLQHDLFPVTACDSEVLGLLMENAAGSLVERTRKAVNATLKSPLVTLALWNRPRKLVAVRRGNPLWTGQDDDGTYLGSLSDDLPGVVKEVRNNSILTFDGSGKMRRTTLQAPAKRGEKVQFLPGILRPISNKHD
jgi:glucosamine 6-phosphate synthetase-like amidotransferase/phosphosugar isomerase protein